MVSDVTKIIHWSFLFYPHLGGLSTYIDSIVNDMPDYDHEIVTNRIPHTQPVEIFSKNAIIKRFNPVDRLHFPSKHMKRRYSLPYGAYCEILRTLRQIKYFKRSKCDLIHVHETDKNLVFLDIMLNTNIFSKLSLKMYDLKKLKKPTLLTKHFLTVAGIHHPKLIEWDYKFISQFDNIICVDSAIYENVTKYFETTDQQKNVCFIPNAIDVDKFAYMDQKNEEKLKIGIVGRLSSETGEQFLMEFLKNIPDFIDVHWACSEKIERIEDMKNEITNDNVHVYSNVTYDHIPNFYHNMNVILNPVEVEYNVSRVTLEAMACGRPVIMENGFIVNHDVNAVLSLLNEINNERSKLQKMGKKGRTLIEEEFSGKVIIPKIKKVYNEINESNDF